MKEVIFWLIVASLVVLIVMNPKGFVADVGAVGWQATSESKILTGSGYQGGSQ